MAVTGLNSPHMFWSLLCSMIAFFSLFQLVAGRRWVSHFDAENEVGHGLMALGMTFMLAPVGGLASDLLGWNIILFAAASLWWACRFFVQKPLLALLFRKNGGCSTVQSDGIHVFMHGGMCYMFLLMRSMALSMTQPATSVTCVFFVSFAFLTLFSGREIAKDLRIAKRNWLQLGANLAQTFMSGMMCWMFLEMISMTMSMR
jgi:Domain of unknown function (DUF5134)